MTDANLELGSRPDGLVVRLVSGDPFTAALVLADDTDAPKAWPAAPVLEFSATLAGDDGPLNVTAALTADPETSTVNSLATWTLTEDQVDKLCELRQARVRLSVDGITWFSGRTSCQS